MIVTIVVITQIEEAGALVSVDAATIALVVANSVVELAASVAIELLLVTAALEVATVAVADADSETAGAAAAPPKVNDCVASPALQLPANPRTFPATSKQVPLLFKASGPAPPAKAKSWESETSPLPSALPPQLKVVTSFPVRFGLKSRQPSV